jgi:hypothetical protein
VVAKSGERLVVIDRYTGGTQWEFTCNDPIASIAVGPGRVLCSTRTDRGKTDRWPAAPAGHVMAFDLSSGSRLWKAEGTGDVLYGVRHDIVITGAEVPGKGLDIAPRLNSAYRLKRFSARRAADGRQLWDGIHATHAFVIGDKVVTYLTRDAPKHAYVTVRDLLTGEQTGAPLEWYQRGCTVLRAGATVLTGRYRANAAYWDIETGNVTPIANVRAACSNNLFPGNGVLAMPDFILGCACNYFPVSQGFTSAAAFPGGH